MEENNLATHFRTDQNYKKWNWEGKRKMCQSDNNLPNRRKDKQCVVNATSKKIQNIEAGFRWFLSYYVY